MKNLRLFIFSVISVITLNTYAQYDVVVHLKDGSSQRFPVSEIVSMVHYSPSPYYSVDGMKRPWPSAVSGMGSTDVKWANMNVGALDEYHVGCYEGKWLEENCSPLTQQGWRLPTKKEIEELFGIILEYDNEKDCYCCETNELNIDGNFTHSRHRDMVYTYVNSNYTNQRLPIAFLDESLGDFHRYTFEMMAYSDDYRAQKYKFTLTCYGGEYLPNHPQYKMTYRKLKYDELSYARFVID